MKFTSRFIISSFYEKQKNYTTKIIEEKTIAKFTFTNCSCKNSVSRI